MPASRKLHRVAVVAVGCISSLGAGAAETIDSLRKGRDSVAPVTLFDVSGTRCKTAGEISAQQLAKANNYHSRAKNLSRASQMMLMALGEANEQCSGFVPERAVIGTTSGGMSFGETFYRSFAEKRPQQQARHWIREYVPQQPLINALNAFAWDVPRQIISNACASGTNAVGNAFLAVRNGVCQSVVCGGYDALSELVFHGFDCLQASTPDKCRPFDAERSGLVLGEGAGILFLEEWEHAVRNGRTILAEILGYGSSTDNHHLTQPNPNGNGPRRAMVAALQQGQVEAAQVDYVNAHGTATLYNDASEGRAILDVCPQSKVSSTKSMMGHSLGAAGAIEAAFCVYALREGFLPPSINFQNQDAALPLDLVANTSIETQAEMILSNSFGFGGSNASILIKRAA
ncbi:MAG: beta-ketoacyl-[acyl-carrier-protein] synthase family protein [Chthoniobacterales bacterium]